MKKYKIIKIFLIIFLLSMSSQSLASSLDGINVDLHVGDCNNNGICEPGNEDFFVCPLDCTPVVIPPSSPSGGSSGSFVVTDNIFNNLSVEVSYNTATVKWKSAIPTMSNLKWGANPDYKDGIIRNVHYLLDHKVEITGLKEGSLYYFSIEASNLLGKTNSLENQVFRTLSLLDTTPSSNPKNLKASSLPSGITISWTNPLDADFDYVRVMKNMDRFYASPFIGRLVYEGKGNYFLDDSVIEGKKYFYSVFSRDRAGNYSSGALIEIIHNPRGEDTWGAELTPLEKVEPLKDIFTITQGTLSYDFKVGSIFHLNGDIPVNIKTNHSSTIKNNDMWVSIESNKLGVVSKYFFSRIKDKEGFLNVDIPPFDEDGYYKVSVYGYDNNHLKLMNQGAFQISKNFVKNSSNYVEYVFWGAIFLLLLFIIYLLFNFILPRLFSILKKKS